MNAMRLRSQRQSTIMSRHHQFFASTVAPEQGASQMNCVKRSKLCRHGLSGAIQRGRVNLDEFEGSDHGQHRLPQRRQFGVRELRAEP